MRSGANPPKAAFFENFSGKSNLKLNKYLDLYAKWACAKSLR